RDEGVGSVQLDRFVGHFWGIEGFQGRGANGVGKTGRELDGPFVDLADVKGRAGGQPADVKIEPVLRAGQPRGVECQVVPGRGVRGAGGELDDGRVRRADDDVVRQPVTERADASVAAVVVDHRV